MQKFSRAVALLAILTLLVPVTVLAQTSRTTGAITGTVTDTSGAPLPGVTVTVTSPNLQGSRTEVTDANGQYTLPSLPPGTYRAEYVLSGVKNVVQEGITVNAQRATSANAQMSLAVTETVTVTASQVVVDPTQTTTQHVMDEQQLKYTAVGSANRSYQNVLSQAPGVSTAGGNPQVSGANIGQNDWYIDGVNSTDPVTHTFGGNMAFDAIQEISVVTFGKDAEYKSSGGTVNVITKSGGNEFSGSLDYRYNDPDFLEQGKAKRNANPPYFGGPLGAESLRFNKDVQTDKSEQPQATLGGPIMRDKLWFFVATHKPETSRQQPNVFGFQPGARTFTGWNTHGKLTYTPFTNQTFTGKFTDSHALVSNTQSNTASNVSPEADAQQTQHSYIYAVAYDAVLSSKWLANLQYSNRPSSLATSPMSGDLETPGYIDDNTNIRTVNYTNNQGRTAERREILGSTTYYLEKFGTHALKAGVDFDHNEFTSFNNATGNPALIPGFDNATYCSSNFDYGEGAGFFLPSGSRCTAIVHTSGGAITRVALGIIGAETTVGADTTSFFAQDEWRPIPRLTARVGVRYDGTTWDSGTGGGDIPDFNLWQPRLGLAFDVFNNAATVIHAYGGKIADENQLTLPSYAAKSLVFGASFVPNGTGGYDFAPDFGVTFGLTGTPIDQNLHMSFSNQYSLGVTQRVLKNTSVDVTAEFRTQKNNFEDYCGTLAFEQDTCVVTNQIGPEGIPQPLKSDYRGILAKVESRPFSWLDFTASWAHAKSRGSVEYNQNAGVDFDYYPVHFTNAYGYLTDDAKDRVKFNGFARLPLDFILGASWNWDSGLAYSVFRTAPVVGYGNLFLEPRGSRRLPHFNQLDMQLQKNFTFGGKYTVGLIGSVFNVLNSETITTINGNAGTRAAFASCAGLSGSALSQCLVNPASADSGIYVDPNQQSGAQRFSASFLRPTAFQRPRRYEVGVRFEF